MASHRYQIPDMRGPHPLGRHVNHDERSFDFPFAARPEAAATVKTVSWQRRVPIFDQGQLGSCTGNAAAGWVGADDSLRSGLVTVDGAGVNEDLAVALHGEATQIDPYKGTYPPTDTGSDGLSVAKALKARSLIDSYTHGFSTTDLVTALQSTPVLIGIPWYDNMFNPDKDGFVYIGGAVAGGHEVCVVGYDDEGKFIVFANSWSTSWGVDGYGKMSLSTLTQLLSQDGDVTVPHALVVAPAPPSPPSPPAPVPPTPTPPAPPTPTPPKPDPPVDVLNWIEEHIEDLGELIVGWFRKHWPRG